MAHYKRRKRKNARGGCLMCKPWKVNGAKRQCEHISAARVREWTKAQMADAR